MKTAICKTMSILLVAGNMAPTHAMFAGLSRTILNPRTAALVATGGRAPFAQQRSFSTSPVATQFAAGASGNNNPYGWGDKQSNDNNSSNGSSSNKQTGWKRFCSYFTRIQFAMVGLHALFTEKEPKASAESLEDLLNSAKLEQNFQNQANLIQKHFTLRSSPQERQEIIEFFYTISNNNRSNTELQKNITQFIHDNFSTMISNQNGQILIHLQIGKDFQAAEKFTQGALDNFLTLIKYSNGCCILSKILELNPKAATIFTQPARRHFKAVLENFPFILEQIIDLNDQAAIEFTPLVCDNFAEIARTFEGERLLFAIMSGNPESIETFEALAIKHGLIKIQGMIAAVKSSRDALPTSDLASRNKEQAQNRLME